MSPQGKQKGPENLTALKTETERRRGTIDLIDILKEAESITGFTSEFTTVARSSLGRLSLVTGGLLVER
ncbi:hypothetical protein [Streptomyces melanogenes]|uniref:hypothetical protein n=1 Tax=Streptomyces melanogenes TaxID=67326 RepID=UPI0037999DC0